MASGRSCRLWRIIFPGARVVAVALHRDSQPSQWDSLAQTLAPLLTSDTLLIQSTDFSHYLPWPQARRYDQETLRVLSTGDPDAVVGLKQPQHLDSRGAQYLQLRLQKQVYQARPAVMASRNSQEYAAQPLESTTSYLVQVYSPENFFMTGSKGSSSPVTHSFGRYLAKQAGPAAVAGRAGQTGAAAHRAAPPSSSTWKAS